MNAILSPDPAIGTLQRFLRLFDLAAVAHAQEELSTEQKSAIAAFASGGMSESERRDIIPLLAQNITAIEHLATLLKKGNLDAELES